MVDIQVKPYHDLTSAKVQQVFLNKIAAGTYFAVLFSPPCSTFSRVVWANKRGPRPVRSYTKPRGFTRMTWAERKKSEWGNTMADFTYKGFKSQVTDVGGLALFENPEDLGAVKSGEHRGIRPASMWQWDEFTALLQWDAVTTVAFYQQDFGTLYLKPTRLLLGNFTNLHPSFREGAPTFDDQGFYLGPLEQRAAVVQLVGAAGQNFATTGTEQWPSETCRWIAAAKYSRNVRRNGRTIMSSLALGMESNPRTRWRTWNTRCFSQRAQNFKGERDLQDSANSLEKKGSSMMEQDSRRWADGMLSGEFGVTMPFGRS